MLRNVYRRILLIIGSILLLASISTAADVPRRVLLLDSFEKGVGVDAKAALISELRTQSPEPLFFYEVSIPGRLAGDRDELSFVNYLHSTFKEQQPDLIVTMAGTAARFAQKNRDQLFPSTPLLFAAVDERFLENSVTPNSTAVAAHTDPPRMIETILQALPETKCVVVVVGTSPLEQFWRDELGREFKRFDNQLTFTWFDDLSFAEILNRSATLPANSAILYVLLSKDAKDIMRSSDDVITELHAKANAPIFGLQSAQLGKGIVGGLRVNEGMIRTTATIALRLLKGEAPEGIKVPPLIGWPPVFDWRELRRWKIDENRLPAGSIIQFRTRTAWDQYKWYVIAGGALSLFEALLVVGLAVNLIKRKRVERSLREAEKLAQGFNRQLVQAQEAERSRLARELHDDITQRLACLAIEMQKKQTVHGQAALTGKTAGEIREEILQLCADVRSMAHKLHPTLLEHLGLASALKTECETFSRQAGITVDAKFEGIADKLPVEANLCLYRVAQETLRNVSRHSNAKTVAVRLTAEKAGVQLVITDNGIGFDCTQPHSGLGLVSMRERVQLLGGYLDIQSKLGHGTTISAWIPLIQEDKPALAAGA